jgi:hypothetical protein
MCCNLRVTKPLHLLQLKISDTAPLYVAESACKALCQGHVVKTTPVCGLTASGQHKVVFPHACEQVQLLSVMMTALSLSRQMELQETQVMPIKAWVLIMLQQTTDPLPLETALQVLLL